MLNLHNLTYTPTKILIPVTEFITLETEFVQALLQTLCTRPHRDHLDQLHRHTFPVGRISEKSKPCSIFV